MQQFVSCILMFCEICLYCTSMNYIKLYNIYPTFRAGILVFLSLKISKDFTKIILKGPDGPIFFTLGGVIMPPLQCEKELLTCLGRSIFFRLFTLVYDDTLQLKIYLLNSKNTILKIITWKTVEFYFIFCKDCYPLVYRFSHI